MWVVSQSMERKSLIFVAIAFLMSSMKGWSAPISDLLTKKLTVAIREHCPEAQIEVTEKTFTAKFETMMFTIHNRNKGGVFSSSTSQEEGPNYKGFILTVSRANGEYWGATATPQTIKGPYFSTYVDAPQTEDSKDYYWVQFSYGSGVDEKLKAAILEALPKIRSEQGFSDKTRVP